MNDTTKVIIDQKEYNELIEIRKKFHQILQSDTYIHYEYVCGAGWGCMTYDNYWILSKDQVTVNLSKKISALLNSYHSMSLWDRVRRRLLTSHPEYTKLSE